MLSLFGLAACSVPLLLFVQFNAFLAPWQSRKVLHMGTGTLLMLSDASDPLFRFGVYAVTAAVLASVGSTRTFHFAAVRDVGIMSYLTFCSVVTWLGVPFWRMAPLFYADPWGAIVGRTVDTPKLVGDKSVGGTLAVACVAALTLFDAPLGWRIVHGGSIAAIELFAGKWDNPAIGCYLLARALSLGHA